MHEGRGNSLLFLVEISPHNSIFVLTIIHKILIEGNVLQLPAVSSRSLTRTSFFDKNARSSREIMIFILKMWNINVVFVNSDFFRVNHCHIFLTKKHDRANVAHHDQRFALDIFYCWVIRNRPTPFPIYMYEPKLHKVPYCTAQFRLVPAFSWTPQWFNKPGTCIKTGLSS